VKREHLLLLLSGANLLIIQFVMMREFSIVLFSTELVILGVSVSYFSGYCIGYFISNRISKSFIIALAAFTFLLHLHVIFLARYVAGYLAYRDLSKISIPLLFFIGAFFVSSFYSIFLPKFICEKNPDSLPSYYSTELLGSMMGLMLILTLGQINFLVIFFIYFIFLSGIISLLVEKRSRAIYLSTTSLILFSFYFPSLDKKSTEYFYNNFYGWFKGKARVVFSDHSPYQKIEVLSDQEGNRSLYLNGLEYFNASDLEHFNFYLSELPARLKRPSSVLIVGSGSMSSVYHVHPFATTITTVEIDRKVYEVGKRFFKEYNHLDEIANWHLVVDDVKHYLKNTEEKFDLVIVDIPAPYYIQTALLFTKEFYSMVKDRLNEGGIISIYLCEKFSNKKKKFLSSRIVAAINTVFDIVNSKAAGYGFLMAADTFSFGKQALADTVRRCRGPDGFLVFDKEEAMTVVADTSPASFSNLDIVLDLNLWALPYELDYN
jgi:spermidine synthase